MTFSRRDALAAGFGAVLLPSTLSAQPAAKPAEFKIGVTTFLSGPASVFGVPSRKACEMLVDQINQQGGQLHDVRLVCGFGRGLEVGQAGGFGVVEESEIHGGVPQCGGFAGRPA